jgi:hypothetical protein
VAQSKDLHLLSLLPCLSGCHPRRDQLLQLQLQLQLLLLLLLLLPFLVVIPQGSAVAFAVASR